MQFKQKVVTTFNQYKRVLKRLEWPSGQEFKTISKVTAIGLLVIGAMGFVMTIILHPIFA